MTAKRSTCLGKMLGELGLRSALGLSLATSLMLAAMPASAQSASDSATAQALFDRAKKLMSQGKYAEACPALEESQRVESRSGTALNLADCYEHEGRLASAWSTFLEAARLAKTAGNADREQGARERAAALVPRLSNLVINAPSAASTPGLEITRDGESVGAAQFGLPLPADAGKHTLAAQAPGRKPWQTEVTVQASASTASVSVPDLERAPVAPASAAATTPAALEPTAHPVVSQAAAPETGQETPIRVTDGVIAGSVVTGLLAVGTIVTSVLYDGSLHDYNTANDTLASNRSDLHSRTKTLGVANLALLGGTVVAAGVTVILWAYAPSKEAGGSASLELRGVVSPGLSGLLLGGKL